MNVISVPVSAYLFKRGQLIASFEQESASRRPTALHFPYVFVRLQHAVYGLTTRTIERRLSAAQETYGFDAFAQFFHEHEVFLVVVALRLREYLKSRTL